MISKFRYGDRVVLLYNERSNGYDQELYVGLHGTVDDEEQDDCPWVLFDNEVREVISEKDLVFEDAYNTPLFKVLKE